MAKLSVYQIIHTIDGEIIALEEHLKLLFEAYYQVFHSGVSLPVVKMRERILSLLAAEGNGSKLSIYVRLTIEQGGEILLSIEERSIYSGYTLRCLKPSAAPVEYDIPYIEYPTSARSAAIDIANLKASRSGADVAIRTVNGVAESINGCQLFAVKGFTIYTQFKSLSVEHALALEAIKGLVVSLSDSPIKVSELSDIEELFYADHYGITAVSRCGSSYYMSIIASEVAQLLTPNS